ncbi:MAG: hypothetical protein MUE42_14610 [Opitutaceae bacterium]|nr:hypothetical protein [Opitutaceae bacterium]
MRAGLTGAVIEGQQHGPGCVVGGRGLAQGEPDSGARGEGGVQCLLSAEAKARGGEELAGEFARLGSVWRGRELCVAGGDVMEREQPVGVERGEACVHGVRVGSGCRGGEGGCGVFLAKLPEDFAVELRAGLEIGIRVAEVKLTDQFFVSTQPAQRPPVSAFVNGRDWFLAWLAQSRGAVDVGGGLVAEDDFRDLLAALLVVKPGEDAGELHGIDALHWVMAIGVWRIKLGVRGRDCGEACEEYSHEFSKRDCDGR